MRIAKLDMRIYDRYITYVELSSACSAPHTQYKSQTKLTKKVVPHRENLTPYKERVSLSARYCGLYHGSSRRSFSCQLTSSKDIIAKNVLSHSEIIGIMALSFSFCNNNRATWNNWFKVLESVIYLRREKNRHKISFTLYYLLLAFSFVRF